MTHTLPALAPNRPLDWQAISRITITPSSEPLVALTPQPRLKLAPAYAAQGIAGASSEIHLRASVAKRLMDALNYLPEKYGFCLLDGWRALAVQHALREHIRTVIQTRHPDYTSAAIEAKLDEFVAKPEPDIMPPPHLTGGAIDLTLYHLAAPNQLIDMGSDFDEPGHRSHSHHYETQPHHPAHHHRRLLHHAMRQAGFSNLPTEWWHFDYGNQNWAYFTHQPHALFAAIEP